MQRGGITKEIIYPKLSYKITGILFKVHNQLGRFCREKQYADAFEENLKEEIVFYEREKRLSIHHDVFDNQVDFSIENKILVDIKAKKFITKDDYYQMKRYLKAASFKLGLIVNFRNTYLKPKRILNLR